MKRVISIMLAVFMLTVSAFAASRTFENTDDKKLNIVIDGGLSEKKAVAGSNVAVTVKLVNNKAISSLKLTLEYDEKLSVATEKNRYGDDVSRITFDIRDPLDRSVSSMFNLREESRLLTLNWVTSSGEVLGDCVYATIVFKVSENAKAGDFLPITVYSINPNDVFDINQNNIDFKVINGGIDIAAVVKGDVDGDMKLTNRDVMMLSKHVSGNTPDGFVTAAADYNNDKVISKNDVTALFDKICEYKYSLPDTNRTFEEVPGDILAIVIDGGEEVNKGIIGRNVSVKINLRNSPGVSSIKSVVYWNDELTLVDAKYDIYDENDKTAVVNTAKDWTKVKNAFAFNWVSAENEVQGDATFVTLTFNIPKGTEDDKFLYVAMSADNIYNAAGDPVDFIFVNGGLDAKAVLIGDATNDGFMDNKDVVMLFRFVSGSISEDKIIIEAADFNADGEINNKDVVSLFRFVSAQ